MAVIKTSTGLRNVMTAAMAAALEAGNGGHIRVFSGAVPADSNAAETGVLLLQITTSGIATGTAGSTLQLSPPSDGLLPKEVTTWTGDAIATGTPTYFRHVATGDTGTLSTSEVRVQGDVGVVGAALNFGVSVLTSGNSYPIDACNYLLPTQ